MDMRHVLKILRHWWWLLIVGTLLAAGSSYLAVRQQPAIYRAQSILMIGRTVEALNPSSAELSLTEQLAATYANLANRQLIRDQTMEALGLSQLPQYTVRSLPNSQLLEIAVTDTSPQRAQAVANELANQLVLQSPTAPRAEDQEREAFVNDQLAGLEVNIRETEDELVARQEELNNAFSAREIEELDQQISALQAKLFTLQGNYASLLSNSRQGAVNTVSVIEPASLPIRPVGPDKLMTVLTTAAIGLTLTMGAAFLLDLLDDRVKSSDDVTRLGDVQLLPGIADFSNKEEESPLVTLTQPLSPVTESFRALRARIITRRDPGSSRSILVTSSVDREGKSVIAANLGVVFAQGGFRVLLIDADLRKPVQHRMFQNTREPGLTDLLLFIEKNLRQSERVQSLIKDAVQTTREPLLHILSSGSQVSYGFELLASESMQRLLAVLQGEYDVVIFDTPPLLAVTDAVFLSKLVDDVVFVARAGRVRRKEMHEAITRLREAQAPLVGAVLNGLAGRTGGYYSYDTRYYDSSAMSSKASADDEDPSHRNGKENEWLRKWTATVPPDEDTGQGPTWG
jgi:polysaccharide biosynthesis transport protein